MGKVAIKGDGITVAAETVIDPDLLQSTNRITDIRKEVEMVQRRRHGRSRGSRPKRPNRPKSYKIVCAGCGKEVVCQVAPPEGRKLLCPECFGKRDI